MRTWIEDTMGLDYDVGTGAWTKKSAWLYDPDFIGPQYYVASLMLYPATVFACELNNAAMLDELCEIWLAAEGWLYTIDELIALGPNDLANAGPGDSKILPAKVGGLYVDNQLYNVQGLLPAFRLVRHIAGIPAGNRTAAMNVFIALWGKVLFTDQAWRKLAVAWSITWTGEPWSPIRLTRWQELYPFPSPPASPYYFNAFVDSDWMQLQNLVEAMHAFTLDPSIYAWPTDQVQAAQAGIDIGLLLCQDRRTTTPDGEVYFLGELYEHPLWTYNAVGGSANPFGSPSSTPDCGWDVSHYHRMPQLLRSLYDAKDVLGFAWPTAATLKASGDYYAAVTFNQNPNAPLFSNYMNGVDGWFNVLDAMTGHPPSIFGDQQGTENQRSLWVGSVWGWGQLASFSENLNTVLGHFILQASTDNEAWREQYAFYADQPFEFQVFPVALFGILAAMPEELD
jgi:hypothetical protein